MIDPSSSAFTTKRLQVGDHGIDVRSNDRQGYPALVLLHGIGVSMNYYHKLADELADTHHVVAIDLPGFGDTAKPKKALNLDQLAEVAAEFIRQEGLVRPTIIGQSMGCQIAARLAAGKQLDIDKVILISPTVNIAERSAPIQFIRLMQDVLREPLRLNWMILIDYLKVGPIRYLITQRYMIADKIERVLAGCRRPILLIHGSRDKIVPARWVSYLRMSLRSAGSVQIAGAPHNLQYTHPKETAATCIEFIQK